jgi:hypothetical protein
MINIIIDQNAPLKDALIKLYQNPTMQTTIKLLVLLLMETFVEV